MAQNFLSDIKLGDSIYIRLGDASPNGDFRMQHNGTHTFMDNHTGNVYIRNYSDDKNIHFQTDDGSGDVTDYIVIHGSENIVKFQEHTRHLDNKEARFGTGSDLKIYHESSTGHSYIKEAGTGDLRVLTSRFVLNNAADTENMLRATSDGPVELYYNALKKFETTSAGINVTGTVTLDTVASIQGTDTGNPQANTDELRVSGYGIMGRRATVYLTNSDPNGSVQIGVSGSHNSNPKLVINASNSLFYTNVRPYTDSTYDLGTASVRWANIYTDAISVLGQGTFDTINTGQGATEVHLMNQNVRTTDNVQFGDLTVTGNLTVTGTSTSVNVEDLNVEQGEITLNYAASSDTSSSANGAGIRIQDAVNATTDATMLWNATDDRFVFSNTIQAPGLRSTTSNTFTGGMSSFETTLTNNDDWQNSPISILERGNVNATQTADKYSPNLNFHWGGVVSRSLWMDHDGHLHYGEYSASGIPDDASGHFLANEVHASVFKDKDSTGYYLDLASTGTSLNVAGAGTFAGTLGIAGSSPVSTSALTIKSQSVSSQQSAIDIIQNGTGTNSIIRMGEKSTDGARLHMFDGGTEKIAFYTDGTANHISAGNLGIGTNNATYKLQVQGTFYVNETAYINGVTTIDASLNQTGGDASTFSGDVDFDGHITLTGSSKNIVLNYNNEIRTKDSGGTERTVLRAASNKLQYGWSYAGEVEFMGGGSYTPRITINTDGSTTFAGNLYIPEYIYHDGNTTTYARFQTNRLTLHSGGGAVVDLHSNGQLYFTGASTFYSNATFAGRTDLQKDLRIRGNDASGSLGVVRFFTDSNNVLSIDTGNDGSNRTEIDGSGNATFAGDVTTTNGLIKGTRTGANMPSSSNANLYLIDSRAMTNDVGGSIVFGGIYNNGGDIISGGPFIKGYKENNTAGDYGFGLKFAVRANGSGAITDPCLTLNSSGNATFAGDLQVGTSLANFEAGFGVDIADKKYNYGAEFQATNASIQVVLGRNNGSSVQGRGGIGADATNAFAVWNTTSTTRKFEVTHAGDGTFAGSVTATSFSGDGSNITGITATDGTKLPLAGGTMTGDLFFNVANQEIRFTHDSDGFITHNVPGRDIIFKTTQSSSLDKTPLTLHGTGGGATFGGNVDLDSDSTKLRLGDGQDLSIYYNGTNGFITYGTSGLYIQGDYPRIQSSGGENMIAANTNAEVNLYFNNVNKFQTTSYGTNTSGRGTIVDTTNPGGDGSASGGGVLTVEGRRDGTANVLTLRARDESAPAVALPDGQGSIIRWQGFDGTDFAQMGAIAVLADGQAVANSDAPSKMVFYTTADGSETLTRALTLDKSQNATFEGNVEATGSRTISAQYDLNHFMRLESNSSGGVLKGTDGGVTTILARSYGDSYFNGGNFGIGTDSPQTTLQVNGSASALNAHFGQGQQNSNGVFGGISLGYAESANALYRKVAIVAEARGDGAARQNLHFLVDTANDQNSAVLADSKFNIDGLTGDATFEGSVTVGDETVTSSTTNHENILVVKGKNNYSDGTNWYGTYGQILLMSDTNMTSSARRFLITNALGNNAFAIVRSVDGNTTPVVNSTGGGYTPNSGTVDFAISNTGNVGIGQAQPSSKLHVSGTNTVGRFVSSSSYVDLIFQNSGGTGGFLNFVNNTAFNLYVGGGSGSDLKLSVSNAGVATFTGDTASGTAMYIRNNTNSIADTKTLIDFRAQASDNSTYYVSGQMGSKAEGTWTSTSSTRDASLIFNTVLNGNNELALTLASDKSATFAGDVTISKSVGDSVLTIEADTDNNNENDNPRIELKQDSGIIYGHFGINGDANNTFTGAGANSTYIRAAGGLDIATNGSTKALTIDTSQNANFAGDISIPVAKKLYFGGGSHTYISEDIDDRLRFFTGGAEFMRFTEDTSDIINFYKDATFAGDVTLTDGSLNITQSVGTETFKVTTPYDRVGKFISTDSGAFLAIQDNNSTDNGVGINVTGNVLKLLTANTPGITLDASQNATFAGDILAEGGDITVKDTGTENAYFRAYATGTGAAGLYIDAVNGDAAGSDYFSLRQLDNKAIEFNARTGTGVTMFYSKGSLNLTQDGADSTFAGSVSMTKGSSQVQLTEYNNGATIWMDGSDGDFTGGDYFGIHAYGTDTLAFSYAGSTKVTLKSDGKLGIGSTTPSHKLQVYDATSDAPLMIESGDGFVGMKFKDPDANDNLYYRGDTESFYFTGNRLGVNTSNPTRQLSVYQGDSGSSYAHFINTTTGSNAGDGVVVGISAAEEAIFWNHENTVMRFATNNDEKARIDTSGRFFIGHTSTLLSSSEKFSVSAGTNGINVFSNSATGNGTLYLQNTNTSTTDWQTYLIFQDGAGNRAQFGNFYNDSKLGISGHGGIAFKTGATSLAAATTRLTITSSGLSEFEGDVKISKSTPVLTFNNTAGGGLDPILTATGTNFTISTSSITPFSLALDDGTLTLDPGQAGKKPLKLVGNYSSSGDVKILEFVRSGDAVAGAIEYNDATTDMEIGTVTNHAFSIKTNDTRAITIDNSQNATFTGNVELGDSSNISMSNTAPGQLQVQGSGYTGAIALNATAMYIYHNSSIRDLVLGTNETARLTIAGNSGNTSITGTFTAAGDVVAFSDERLKSNIETLDGSKVYDMRGVSFTKDNVESSGVIAQELEKVAPELVNNDSEYKSVAYGNITGYLIEAIKDLKAEVEDLKKQLKNK